MDSRAMGALAPYFEFVGTATWSAVWLNTKPIPPAALAANPYDTASLDELQALFDRAIDPIKEPVHRIFLEQARARMIAEHGAKAEALRLLDGVEREWQVLKEIGRSPAHLLEWTNPAKMRHFLGWAT